MDHIQCCIITFLSRAADDTEEEEEDEDEDESNDDDDVEDGEEEEAECEDDMIDSKSGKNPTKYLVWQFFYFHYVTDHYFL